MSLTPSDFQLLLNPRQNPGEPMQVDQAQIVEVPCTFDLESYSNSYTGLARLYRLIFVSEVCPTLRVEALKIAIGHVLSSYNVKMYELLHQKLQDTTADGAGIAAVAAGAGGAASAAGLPDVADQSTGDNSLTFDWPAFDPIWVQCQINKASLKLEKLQLDIANFKTQNIKETIRRGHDDLGDHFLNCGDLTNALNSYSLARDLCTSGRHMVNMYINVIRVSIYLENWSNVLRYVSEVEHMPDYLQGATDLNQTMIGRIKCAAGIAELQSRNYKKAAKHFLQANFEFCDFPDMLSPKDVAMYAGLCALASYDRQELHEQVIASLSFRPFLELEPELRDIIGKFYESKIAPCLKMLNSIRDYLLLDMYMAPHVKPLYTEIRERALVQYFLPYQSADMRIMATTFDCSVEALEDELVQLIFDMNIDARIDSQHKILYAAETDERIATLNHVLSMGREYQNRARMLMVRAAVKKANIRVEEPKK